MKVKNILNNEILFVIAKREHNDVSYQVLDEETWTPYWINSVQLRVAPWQIGYTHTHTWAVDIKLDRFCVSGLAPWQIGYTHRGNG